MYRLYDYLSSGNSYKVRLLLSLLGISYERIDVDIIDGQTRTAAFLARNPNGRIPTLELEDGTHLWESNAILHYLAEATPFLPAHRLDRARVLQWMFFEQYSHEPYIAVLRFWHMHGPMDKQRQAQIEQKREGGNAALAIMQQHLQSHDWFVGRRMTIADIALYAYTHVAGDGGFDLGNYPAIEQWLARVAAQPGYVPITAGTD
ncbi:MAG: glutathione S-transferase family protein [Gammaproteobacteria bacterium]|nr:glutathione S-transferase family protein [Gammaproteobacteria bacterium]